MKEQLLEIRKKIERQDKRTEPQIERLNNTILSTHGNFSLGYEKGKSAGFNYALDLIDSILES